MNVVLSRLARPEPGRAGCTVACIFVHGGPTTGDILTRVARSVRADDRTCPFSVSHMAVQFGPSADDILPQVLGDRLARAAGVGNVPEATTFVSIGIAAPGEGHDDIDAARRAMAAGRMPATSSESTPRTVVTVDRPAATRFVRRSHRLRPALHRRTRYRPGSAGRVGPTEANAYTVLVVDPLAPVPGRPGHAAQVMATAIADLGCRVSTITVAPDDALQLSVEGTDVDLLAMALDGGRVSLSPTWTIGAWGVPARLAASYAASGIPVLAVSAGFSAGAVAACVAQGALPVISTDGVADAVRTLRRYSVDEVRGMSDLGLAPRFQALVGLTASERRVLFYLTEGWTAQDVADELVVSLTTIRSHIGSVLRKLGVKSQVAAVAIANSRDPWLLGTAGAS